MFRLSLSHLQALMIQIHTKNVLCSHIHVLIVIHSLTFTTDIVSVGDPTMHSTFFV